MKWEPTLEPDLDAMAVDLVGEAGDSRVERTITRIEDLPTLESVSADPIVWAVDDLIAMAAVNMISSEPGAGKSTFISAAAHAVSMGADFLGRKCSQHPVLMLDVENPHAVVLERFHRLGITTNENFHVWGQWLPDEPPSAGGAVVMEWVSRCEPKPLIVVDSFIGFHPGAENDSAETRRYMSQYRRLAAMGAGIGLLHHTGKGETSKDYRGSSDIKAGLDIGYHLANLSDGPELGLLRLRAFKARFSAAPELVFRYVAGQFIVERAAPRAAVSEVLTKLLKANPGIGVIEFVGVAAEKGLGRNRGRQFLNDGVAAGLITSGRGARNKKTFFWGREREGLFE